MHAVASVRGPTLRDSVDCSPPGSSVRGIPQARILEWVAISTSRGSSRPRDGICVPSVSCIGSRFCRGKAFAKSRLSGWEEEEAGRAQAPVTCCLSWDPA